MSIPNNIQLQNESSFKIPIRELQQLAAIVFFHENVPETSFVNLLITEKETIRKYNLLYRGVDNATDVLSFPSEQNFLPLLGDILIDIDVCIQQKGNKTWQEELEILFLHALLHLLGHEHVSIRQKKTMEAKEKKYWNFYKKECIKNSGR